MTTPTQVAKAVERAKEWINRPIDDQTVEISGMVHGQHNKRYLQTGFACGLLAADAERDAEWNRAIEAAAAAIGAPSEDPGEFENWSNNDGDVDAHARKSADWHNAQAILKLLRPTTTPTRPEER